jgi:hypothetical protein
LAIKAPNIVVYALIDTWSKVDTRPTLVCIFHPWKVPLTSCHKKQVMFEQKRALKIQRKKNNGILDQMLQVL